MYIGIDLGGTKTATILVDEAGNVICRHRQETELADLVANIKTAIKMTLQIGLTNCDQLLGIGIGIPGMVDHKRGRVELATNLNIFKTIDISDPISAEFNCPVSLENDVRLATLGVISINKVENLAYLSIGTGVAAGIILGGSLYRGSNNMAGEIGHVIVDNDGTILEKLIAGPALLARARSAGLVIEQGSEVYQLAQSGNETAKAIIQKISYQIARTIQWLVVAYDVDQVVLGGGVTHAGEIFITPILAELAVLRSQNALTRKLLPDSKVSLLEPTVNAGLLGAVSLARQAALLEQIGSTAEFF